MISINNKSLIHFAILIFVVSSVAGCNGYDIPAVDSQGLGSNIPQDSTTGSQGVGPSQSTGGNSSSSTNPQIKPYDSSKRPAITSGMNSHWAQVNAPIKNSSGQRDPNKYIEVLEQFDVQNSYPARYKPGGAGNDDTRCNIYAGDVMRAMGAALPTKGELGKGQGSAGPNKDPMTAQAPLLYDFLNGRIQLVNSNDGAVGGWRRVDVNNPADMNLLKSHLESGKPAVASDPGHIAVLRPDGLPNQITKDNVSQLRVAQAGARNFNNSTLADSGYGGAFQPEIFIHD